MWAGEIHPGIFPLIGDERLARKNMATASEYDSNTANYEEAGSMLAIVVEKLFKSFGSQKVLNGISLSVGRGETLAVLGRRRHGKSSC